jgi:hypothetical protein
MEKEPTRILTLPRNALAGFANRKAGGGENFAAP